MNWNIPPGIDIQQMLMVALIGAVTALLSGKLVRRLLLLPFELISRKTENKIDDKLVEEARQDLGVPDSTLPEKGKKEEK